MPREIASLLTRKGPIEAQLGLHTSAHDSSAQIIAFPIRRRAYCGEVKPKVNTIKGSAVVSQSEDIHQHIQSLRRYAIALVGNPAEADDLVQEALRRVLEHVRKKHDIQNLKAYLFMALRNVRLDQIKALKTRGVEVPVEDVAGNLATRAQQDVHLECRDLSRALGVLTEDQRQAVLMICMEGLSYEEVADITDVPIGTVRSRLHRGREALRDYLNMRPAPAIASAAVAGLNKEISEANND